MTDAPASTPRFPCASCGGALEYTPGADSLACPWCGEINEMRPASPWEAADALKELDLEDALSGALSAAEHETARVVPCPSCGAEVGFDADDIARACPWCAAPLTTEPVSHDALRPRGVLPFLVEEKTAQAAMKSWLGSLWFAPSGLAKFARAGRAMDGLYMPCWTFDAQADTQYRGQRGDTYYETQTVPVRTEKGVRMETRQVPKIRWSARAGRVRRAFDDVLRPATRALEPGSFERLGGWDLEAMEPFDSRYLAGFRAETHSVPLDQGWSEAQQVMARVVERDIRFDIGGDRQKIDWMDMRLSDATFKHVLLPVWLAAYRYKGEVYRVAVNGRTGQVQGDRPWSWGKIAVAVLVGAVVAGGIGFLLAQKG
ncbi:primosomal protein N' (replication factor Y) - superfamily II helicase [Rhodovulum sp. DZ06]|uniref:primosomal protein N' (replication factor Y) - superfamily II helicase n=1 Tax=Rhodovulum sp. DZ06 TaxID=3425126 RepID=UPI003D33AEC7